MEWANVLRYRYRCRGLSGVVRRPLSSVPFIYERTFLLCFFGQIDAVVLWADAPDGFTAIRLFRNNVLH